MARGRSHRQETKRRGLTTNVLFLRFKLWLSQANEEEPQQSVSPLALSSAGSASNPTVADLTQSPSERVLLLCGAQCF